MAYTRDNKCTKNCCAESNVLPLH